MGMGLASELILFLNIKVVLNPISSKMPSGRANVDSNLYTTKLSIVVSPTRLWDALLFTLIAKRTLAPIIQQRLTVSYFGADDESLGAAGIGRQVGRFLLGVFDRCPREYISAESLGRQVLSRDTVDKGRPMGCDSYAPLPLDHRETICRLNTERFYALSANRKSR